MKKIQKEIYDENNVLIKLSCIICQEEKNINCFYKNKQRKCGYRAFCIDCNKQQKKQYYLDNKEKVLQQTKAYWLNNLNKHRLWEKEWRNSNKEKILLKRKERIKNNPSLKLRNTIARRILLTLKKSKISKNNKTSELLGAEIETVKRWIEQQFNGQMSWENHGKVWHIDHIKPCCSFDLTIPEQQFECFNYKNLRPLLKEENLKKAAEDKKKSVNK